jgi:hypothetical protein
VTDQFASLILSGSGGLFTGPIRMAANGLLTLNAATSSVITIDTDPANGGVPGGNTLRMTVNGVFTGTVVATASPLTTPILLLTLGAASGTFNVSAPWVTLSCSLCDPTFNFLGTSGLGLNYTVAGSGSFVGVMRVFPTDALLTVSSISGGMILIFVCHHKATRVMIRTGLVSGSIRMAGGGLIVDSGSVGSTVDATAPSNVSVLTGSFSGTLNARGFAVGVVVASGATVSGNILLLLLSSRLCLSRLICLICG